MPAWSLTIAETVAQIRASLRDYIEATYHIGNPAVVAQRRALLDQEGVLHRAPYIESTPRYTKGKRFSELHLPEEARALLAVLSDGGIDGGPLAYDPPYAHQAVALEASITEGKSLVITTGTGSGKTEAFLLPILAKLAIEAQRSPTSFTSPAIRALLLYPMNALVNDQLGRLRLMVGSDAVSNSFVTWAGRPARFARYTSRTLYPGVRTVKKDQQRLKPIDRFYLALLETAADVASPRQEAATKLVENLQRKGKWPAKPDLRAWYGAKSARWLDRDGSFVRGVTLPDDPELLTRHEVLEAPPDILVTNYSMLEYMLMRPLERPVFDATRNWLAANPDERLLLVVDEAHLYRGAAGAEVGLLLRRLRARLGIDAERMQVICTSASFNDKEYAREFAAQLSGKQRDDFLTVTGELAFCSPAASGTEADADLLANLDLDAFYSATDESDRLAVVDPLLTRRSVTARASSDAALHEALVDFPPMNQLINSTMVAARRLEELGAELFDTDDSALADHAVTALVALGSTARQTEGEPSLLPCRVHGFFRGLPGLWACMDPDCSELEEHTPGGPIGTLFGQPRSSCGCGARVFEFYTCRNCGAAYGRAYADDLARPSFLWSEPGRRLHTPTGEIRELEALDLLLEEPSGGGVEPADLDLITGRVNPMTLGLRTRQIFLKLERSGGDADPDDDDEPPAPQQPPNGEFRPCGVCGQSASFGRSSVQDHQTKGDQPFQALVTRQIEVQPPSPQPYSDFAPLRGRKVLAFSDSRQTAARLAPNLQTYSMRDVIRPLILHGWRDLEASSILAPSMNLEDLYLSVMVGAHNLKVRLRPELRGTESLHAMREVEQALERGGLDDPAELLQLRALGAEPPPQSLLRAIVAAVADRWYGLTSLALASVRERRNLEQQLQGLPPLDPVATTPEQRVSLARAWISQWLGSTPGVWFQNMTPEWWQTAGGVRPHSGKFAALERWLGQPEMKRRFARDWTPVLLEQFCEQVAPGKYRIRAGTLSLDVGGTWAYCQGCRTTQRPFPDSQRCVNCARERVVTIDPDTDEVFSARKRYYRASSTRALSDPPLAPMAIIAAEHTAQLNAAQAEEVFSKAEEHELLFQDLDLGLPTPGEQAPTAIDVLSCTTTMEVGIDIGALSGVALRNMPPSRASYQQRAGRAGRRASALATVVAFGSADSHDEHYFSNPDAMIRGQVDDPTLTLDNAEIARRHITAFLLQRYHETRLPHIDPEEQPHLFEVLGTVSGFMRPDSALNRSDFEAWLRASEVDLAAEVTGWLPDEIDVAARAEMLSALVEDTLNAIDQALEGYHPRDAGVDGSETAEEPTADDAVEAAAEVGEERGDAQRSAVNLLDRLLYKGVLPRYAFPTDVVAFHVFDVDASTRFRPAFRYAPSQGLPVALTQYAPGKEVWIDGKLWTSRALYSPMADDRFLAWQERKLYFECRVCHYAMTTGYDDADRGEVRDCPACGEPAAFGSAKNWMRPPGFAHPVRLAEGTSPDDQPARSYATRAKLAHPGPADPDAWRRVTPGIREYYDRTHLLVTNTGPRTEGYTYCTRCGLIEPTALATSTVQAPHPKPYPDDREPNCDDPRPTRGLVLGTDFISDVLLVSLTVDRPLSLRPGHLATDVVLRTVSEALTIAATHRLEIEPSELQAEYRPALSPGGHDGLEAEIYMYDTLAGGAGFARRSGELGIELFNDAIALLEGCPAGCDYSCYRCLRSFKNRFEHDLLDRHLGASLLRCVVRGEEPALAAPRINSALNRLCEDLQRHGIDGVEFRRNVPVDVAGVGSIEAPILATTRGRDVIIGVHGPLTPDHATDAGLREAKEYSVEVPVILVDEIVVSRSLPRASQQVIDALA